MRLLASAVDPSLLLVVLLSDHVCREAAQQRGRTQQGGQSTEEEINQEGSLWPEELLSDEKNYRLLGISSDAEGPNEELWSRQKD